LSHRVVALFDMARLTTIASTSSDRH